MNYETILVLSPHTDDAELGAGGFISKLISENKFIYWVVFSTAEESLPEGMPKDTLVKEFENVLKYLGLKESNYKIFNFSVRKLKERRQEILEILIKLRKEINPDLIIGPSLNDHHQDHQVVCQEMIRAFKTSASIISYELPWNHLEFKSQLLVRINEEQLQKKLEMLKFYKSQIAANRHYFSEDFIRGLAYSRGAQVNSKLAEAFEVIRLIQ
jgi:LmbE family N-acetylglucosaminyl deacetylase